MSEIRVRAAMPSDAVAAFLRIALLAGAVALLLSMAPSAHAAPGLRTTRASGTALNPANGDSFFGSLSAAGRYVAFQSHASNLAAGGGSGADVFVRDSRSSVTRCVSIASNGATPNGVSASPSISSDGRLVAFSSNASNLVPGDVNGSWDVFVRTMASSTVATVSVSSAGVLGDGDSSNPVLSANGRRVAFVSSASTLVPGDTAGRDDIFVRDLASGTTTRVSLGTGGLEANGDSSAPSISGDGSKVAFVSRATNLIAGDTNDKSDVFVVDVATLATTRVSVGGSSTQANLSSFAPSISGNGRKVAFESLATNLVPGDTNEVRDVFVRDLVDKITVRASVSSSGAQANAESREPSISHHGTRLAFSSSATNLVTNDTNSRADVFLRKLDSSSTSRLSVSPSRQASAACGGAIVAADGSRVVYQSSASNLVGHDYNGKSDLFVASYGTRAYDRVQGGSVYATAVQASRRAAPNGAAAVVVVNGGDWRSALAASSLAGAVRGTLLYTASTGVPPETRAEIVRLGAKRVFAVGGTNLVPQTVMSSLATIPGVTGVERVGSGSSYSVATAVASKVVSLRGAAHDGTVLVVSGKSAASSIAGVPLASAVGRPIVFVNPSTGTYTLPARTTRAIILGSKKVVSSAVARRLQAKLGRSRVTRLSGTDRYLTATAIAKRSVAMRHAWDLVTIVNVTAPTEAICGAVMAGRNGSVVVYSTQGRLPRATRDRLSASKYRIDTVYIVGTTSSIGASPVRAIKKALGD